MPSGFIEFSAHIIAHSASFWLSLEQDPLSLFGMAYNIAKITGMIGILLFIVALIVNNRINEIIIYIIAIMVGPPAPYIIAGIIVFIGRTIYSTGFSIAWVFEGYYGLAAALAFTFSAIAITITAILLERDKFFLAVAPALLDVAVFVPTLAAALYLSPIPAEALGTAVRNLILAAILILFLALIKDDDVTRRLAALTAGASLLTVAMLPLAVVPLIYFAARIITTPFMAKAMVALIDATEDLLDSMENIIGWVRERAHNLFGEGEPQPLDIQPPPPPPPPPPQPAPQPVHTPQQQPQAAGRFEVDACGFRDRVEARTLGELYQAIGVDPASVALVRVVTQGGLEESPDPAHLGYPIPGDAVFVEVICR